MLESFGLDPTATSVYRIWLRDGSISVAELADRLCVSVGEVETAQQELVDRGLLLESWEEPGKLIPLNPEAGIERLYREQQAELTRQEAKLASARAALTELVEEYARGVGNRKVTDSIDHLQGIDEIRSMIAELGARTEREMLAMHPASVHSAESLKAALPLDVEAMDRGVALRSLYTDRARLDPDTAEYLQAACDAGMQIRCAPAVPMRMLVFDRNAGMVPLHPVDTGRAAMVVRGEALVAVLVLGFEQLWANSELFSAGDQVVEASHESLDPSDSDRALLRLLSLGVKDEAAARHMGVSVRTVRRQIADLMRRLEAESRFQAGIRAAHLGWL